MQGWGFQILPYLELTTIWNPQGNLTNNDKLFIQRTTPIPTFNCPTRRGGGGGMVAVDILLCDQDGEHAGWRGPRTPTQMSDYGSSTTSHDGWQSKYYSPVPWRQGINIGSITDGTSSTFIVGEMYRPNRLYYVPTGDQDVGYVDGWDPDTVRFTSRWNDGWGGGNHVNPTPYEIWLPYPDSISGAGQDPGWGDWRFGGPHPEKFLMCFADASVHPVPFNVDPILWYRQGCRNDGLSVDQQ